MIPPPLRAGQFVWCAYPEREAPHAPGPLHVGYVLLVADDDAGAVGVVAYTTSQSWQGSLPRGVRRFSQQEAERLGQRRAFVLDLRRIAMLPLTEMWFPNLPEPEFGILGAVSAALREQIQQEASELARRSPEVIERLGPR